MAGFNQVILFGNLGNDPELKYTQGGSAVVSLSIATSRRAKRRDSDEWEDVTSWHRAKAFGKTAEVIGEHCRKGDKLFIEGRLDYWEAEGKRGKLMVAEIIVEHFDFGGSRRDASGPGGPSRGAPPSRGAQAPRGGQRPGSGRQAPENPLEDVDTSGGFVDDDIPF